MCSQTYFEWWAHRGGAPDPPNDSLDAPECIISTAHHAKPKVIGHREPLRAQFTRSSTFATTYSHPSLPRSSKLSTLDARTSLGRHTYQR